jgi:hypothetical protein
MKTLLSAIKKELQDKLTDIRDADIFIAPHINYIPASVRMPCVAIKDGKIQRKELTGGAVEETLTARLSVYTNLRKDEAAIMGDASANQKGILDLVEDVHSELHQNLLGISGMMSAMCTTEEESEMFGDDTAAVMRKIITYQYDQQN